MSSETSTKKVTETECVVSSSVWVTVSTMDNEGWSVGDDHHDPYLGAPGLHDHAPHSIRSVRVVSENGTGRGNSEEPLALGRQIDDHRQRQLGASLTLSGAAGPSERPRATEPGVDHDPYNEIRDHQLGCRCPRRVAPVGPACHRVLGTSTSWEVVTAEQVLDGDQSHALMHLAADSLFFPAARPGRAGGFSLRPVRALFLALVGAGLPRPLPPRRSKMALEPPFQRMCASVDNIPFPLSARASSLPRAP